MLHVLIVEDSPEDAELLGAFLASEGFTYELATSGHEALIKYQQQSFDLILSDYLMMNGDGLWLLQNIGAEAKCIIMTADTSTSRETFFAAGARGFCFKPLIWPILKKEIDRVLSFSNRP